MGSELGCDDVRELAAELALGIAIGDERARALAHLAECRECRVHVAQLTGLADELLLIAPRAEPPLGFEARVLEEIAPRPRRAPLRRLALAGLAAATAAVTAIAMFAAFRGDHRLASAYRAALAQAHGLSFKAVPLRDPAGARAGQVFAYEGNPPWIFVTVARRDRSLGYRCQLVTRDGRRILMPAFAPDARTGSWGGNTPVPLRQVRAIEVSSGERGEVLVARLVRE